MEITKDTGPYVIDKGDSSVIELTAVLNDVLRNSLFTKPQIKDLAIEIFLNNEVRNIKSPTAMHLLAIKKILLYATPVITPPGGSIGIGLTSQVRSDVIVFRSNKATQATINAGDKFRLIGLTFDPELINRLPFDVFQWKFFRTLPEHYRPRPIDLSNLPGIETKNTKYGDIFLIKASHYEDTALYNAVNKLIALRLTESLSAIQATADITTGREMPPLLPIEPFNSKSYIDKLNAILPISIDRTFTNSLYECLKATSNWLLYDQIELIGFDSQEVQSQLPRLAYIKEQTMKVKANERETTYKILLKTRAEKITRDKYPYYFDYTDRRAIFVRFNRFAIDKLPAKEQNEVNILLEKELAMQHALLNNKCEHLKVAKEDYRRIESYINFNNMDSDKMYACKLCSYPLMCAHEVDLYEGLASIDENSNIDQSYIVRQKIINRYKAVNLRRTGVEGTDASFMYYCKHCGGELGQTDDAIQSTIKSQSMANIADDAGPTESLIYLYVLNTIKTYMNDAIMPMSKKWLMKLIFNECKSDIIRFVDHARKIQRDNIDKYVKYLTTTYTLVCLISINLNILKSPSSILVELKRHASPKPRGSALKDELLVAFQIISANDTLKGIGITDDKIKGLLIEAFKSVNKTFASELIQLKSISPRDRLVLDIKTNPVAIFAKFMYDRAHRQSPGDIIDVSGVDLDALFPKNKKQERATTHALFANLYDPKSNESTDLGKYLMESYKRMVSFVKETPIAQKYTSIVFPPLTSFAKSFQSNRAQKLKMKRIIPVRFLPVVNSREHDFRLTNYNIAYCASPVRPHRWTASIDKQKLRFVCKHCGISIDQANKASNNTIDELLYQQMLTNSFFELYTLSCPIKDAHVFESGKCEQCGVAKEQIAAQDSAYYKKHATAYLAHRASFTKQLISNTKSIMEYSTPMTKAPPKSKPVEADLIKLESLCTSLNKLFNQTKLSSLGRLPDGTRSLERIKSYVRLFYSHYLFAKNISIDMQNHSDPRFFEFIKTEFFDKISPKQIDFKPLPEYPIDNNPDALLIKLCQIIHDTVSKGNGYVSKLTNFVISKIINQNERHEEYNFMKLKSAAVYGDGETVSAVKADEEDEEEDNNLFDGYDIGGDDMEDNINGDLD